VNGEPPNTSTAIDAEPSSRPRGPSVYTLERRKPQKAWVGGGAVGGVLAQRVGDAQHAHAASVEHASERHHPSARTAPSELLLVSPSELSASPSELLISPRKLLVSPSELLASPRKLTSGAATAGRGRARRWPWRR
jgi:hypothetical protein